jgi:hypothetical protein
MKSGHHLKYSQLAIETKIEMPQYERPRTFEKIMMAFQLGENARIALITYS